MNSIYLMKLVTLCLFINTLAISTTVLTKNEQQNSKKATTDSDKINQQANTLIADFFKLKGVNVQNVPAEMKEEFNFKKEALIKILTKISNPTIDDTTPTSTAAESVDNLFKDFVQRIIYAQITDLNTSLINALNEKKSGNTPNCSYPKIDPLKQHLLG